MVDADFQSQSSRRQCVPKTRERPSRNRGIEFSTIESGFSKEKEVENQIWDKALANARERAEKTLKAMGMKIDSIFAVSPVAFPEIQSKLFGVGPIAGAVEVERMIEAGPQYRLAPITVSQSVHVIYLISPVK